VQEVLQRPSEVAAVGETVGQLVPPPRLSGTPPAA
jgi:hypothetical protein